MHYGDKKHLENNVLKLVIYIHENLNNPEKRDIVITSIQECQYFDPVLLSSILKKPKKLKKFKEFKTLTTEQFWLLTIKQTSFEKFKIVEIDNVSKKGEFFQLH